MLTRHIVLLIVIRPSDGDVKPGGPLGAFWEEQAMSQHQVSPSPFLSSSSLTTQLHYTYSHPNLNFLQYCTDTLPTRNVVCPSGAWFKNRPHLTPSICLVWNPKCVIVQWVGIRTDRLYQFNSIFVFSLFLWCRILISLSKFNLPLLGTFTWSTPPGPYRARTCQGRKLNYRSRTYFFDHTRTRRTSPDEWSAQCRGHLQDSTNMKDNTHQAHTQSSQQGEYGMIITTAKLYSGTLGV